MSFKFYSLKSIIIQSNQKTSLEEKKRNDHHFIKNQKKNCLDFVKIFLHIIIFVSLLYIFFISSILIYSVLLLYFII